MTKKWLMTLALAGLSIASAKTYTLTIDRPSMVGTTQLQPGDYRLKVEGSTALLTNNRDGKEVKANVKVENAAKKFEYTAIESRQEGDVNHIKDVHLGGTRMTIDFD